MSKIATFKTFHKQLFPYQRLPTVESLARTRAAISASGVSMHSDGRAYVPESQRGEGVGYQKKGA